MKSRYRWQTGVFLGAWLLLGDLWHAPAQAFEFSGGASSLYDAVGATLTVHGESTEASVGAGLQNGHLAAGGALRRNVRGGLATVGLQQLAADVPTDIFDDTHLFAGVGVGLKLGNAQAGSGLTSFVGFTSTDGGSPLFSTADLESPAAFAQWSHTLGKNCRATTTGIFLHRALGLESVECTAGAGKSLRVGLTGGGSPAGPYGAGSLLYDGEHLRLRAGYLKFGQNVDRSTASYGPTPESVGANISAEYELTRSWSASALHENFIIPAFLSAANPQLDTPREQTSLDQVGLGFHGRKTLFSVSALWSSLKLPQAVRPPGTSSSPSQVNSSSNAALAVTLEHDWGRLRWTENFVDSASSTASRQRMAISGLALRLNPHLLLSESVDVTQGRLNFAHGGEFITGTSSLRIDYELLYLANRGQDPFEQAAVVTAGFHLWRSVGIEATSTLGATGSRGYTARLTGFESRNGTGGQAGMTVHVGESVIAGVVVDEAGGPIAGAALLIGATHLYTDSHGIFTFREHRPAAHNLRILTEEFLVQGAFQIVNAPGVVTSREQAEQPIRIVLCRQPLIEGSRPGAQAFRTTTEALTTPLESLP